MLDGAIPDKELENNLKILGYLKYMVYVCRAHKSNVDKNAPDKR